ncbi:MAG: hypothetical protein VB957_09130 [Pseudomonadales bacterium]
MQNLVTLCRFHHGLLHKGEDHIHKDDKKIAFTNSRNETITQSFYPKFEAGLVADDCLDVDIDENTARCEWRGGHMDIQHSLQCMFQLE